MMAAVFVDGNDLLGRIDRRDVAELAVDSDVPLDDVAIAQNANVLLALEDAEGEVIAALQSGGRYTVAQLSDLAGSSLSYLQRIICEIAMLHLYRRRPSWKPEVFEAYSKIHEMHLAKLAKGDAIFGGEDLRLTATRASTDGATLTEINHQNTMVGRSNYFRKPVLPNGRNV